MKQKNIAWKVVRNVVFAGRKSFISASGAVDYSKENVWIYPREGFSPYLFVFKSRQYARRFIKEYGCVDNYFKILKVEVINPHIEDVWKTHDGMDCISSKLNTTSEGFPKGTILVDCVKVIGKE